LAAQPLPGPTKADTALTAKFVEVQKIVAESRRLIAAAGVKKPKLYYRDAPLLEEQAELIERLARLGTVQEAHSAQTDGFKLLDTKYDIWLDIDKPAIQSYADKLQEQKAERQASIKLLEQRLANKDYTERAPKELVEESKQNLETEKQLLAALEEELNSFQKSLKS
jgi:valyl-tRNA synthetase